jgi:hypothetical protein
MLLEEAAMEERPESRLKWESLRIISICAAAKAFGANLENG